MDGDEYRVRSLAIWEAMAPGWERDRAGLWDASGELAEWMVQRLDPHPADTVLELAAGPGDTGFLAARRLTEGTLISSDFSPAMVEAARRRGTELGLANVDYRVLDAERIELQADSVDGVLCRWGYMLMGDPGAALRETRRVLRPAGRLVLSVWGPQERNPWAFVGRILVEHGHAAPAAAGAPGLFSMASRERILELLAGAGFGKAEIEEMEVTWTFADFDAYWAFITDLAGAVSITLATLPDAAQRAVRAEAADEAGDYRSGGGLVMPGHCLNAVAS